MDCLLYMMYNNTMNLTKTYEKDNYIRIDNSEGDSITVYVEGTTAFLLSIFVSFQNRGLGRGAELLTAMEGYLVTRGVDQLIANFSSKLLNVCDLLDSCGFTVTEGNTLIAYDALDILTEPRVAAAIREGKKHDLFKPLASLDAGQTRRFMEFLGKGFRPLSVSYLAGFRQDLSGVVFDTRGQIGAVIVCSKQESDIHIDYIAVAPGDAAQYLKPLISGFASRLSVTYEAEWFERITYIHANTKIKRLINDYIGDYRGTEVNISYSADKTLSGDKEPIAIREGESMADDDFMYAWTEDVASVPYQNNIFVKGML